MSPKDKPLVWLHGEVKSAAARLEAGFLLRALQQGRTLSLPHSRPMPLIGRRCHELRITDEDRIWRIVYRTESDAVLIIEVFSKKTTKTPKSVIETSIARLRNYDSESE